LKSGGLLEWRYHLCNVIFTACPYLLIAQDLDQPGAHNNLWLVRTLSMQDRDETARTSLLPTACPTIYVSNQCTEGRTKNTSGPTLH